MFFDSNATMLPLKVCIFLYLLPLFNCNVIVQTQCGAVQGIEIDGVHSFRGIPYALAPTGSLRWKPPVELSHEAGNCWNGTFSADEYGNTCFQISFFDPARKKLIGDEDCLYLNVITPDTQPKTLKPVMVWIHGGFLEYLNGNWPVYMPTEQLAKELDVIFVGFNYRLHAFGFMALQVLADQSPTNTSGNYGFMDMIAVLKWVQSNIQNFGGDPNKVTVFGQSSGGTSIFALLASPLCKGLFHKAWLMSGSPILNKTAQDAFKDNEIFLKNTNCSDVKCLYSLSAEEVTFGVPWTSYPYWAMLDLVWITCPCHYIIGDASSVLIPQRGRTRYTQVGDQTMLDQGDLPMKGYFDGALAIVDGIVLTDAPFEAWSRGVKNDVPVLIGSCANEIDFDPADQTINTWTWSKYEEHIKKYLGTFSEDVMNTALKLYPSNHISPEFQLTSMASDLRMNCPNDVLSLHASTAFLSPVYRYVVTSIPSVPIHPFGAPFPSRYSIHLWDAIAFFGFIPNYIKYPTERDIEWQRNVQNEVMSFIHTGKPATLSWKPYPMTTANLSFTTEPLSAYNPVQCEFWLKNGFFSYAWIN